MDYYSRKQLMEIFKNSLRTDRLTFDTFYQRVHAMGWSIEKSLSYPVKKLNLRYRINREFYPDEETN